MKATEKKMLTKMLIDLKKVINEAESKTDKAFNEIPENNFSNESYENYKQRFQYLMGAQRMLSEVTGYLNELGIKEVK